MVNRKIGEISYCDFPILEPFLPIIEERAKCRNCEHYENAANFCTQWKEWVDDPGNSCYYSLDRAMHAQYPELAVFANEFNRLLKLGGK